MSSGELDQVFKFGDRKVRVHLDEVGEAWFVAVDVCACLEVGNSRDALSRLEDDEKGVVLTDTLGGHQEMAAVNEAGLYSLVLSSRKESARPFKRWVTHEVLPTLRKTGRYVVTGAPGTEVVRLSVFGFLRVKFPAHGFSIRQLRQFGMDVRMTAKALGGRVEFGPDDLLGESMTYARPFLDAMYEASWRQLRMPSPEGNVLPLPSRSEINAEQLRRWEGDCLEKMASDERYVTAQGMWESYQKWCEREGVEVVFSECDNFLRTLLKLDPELDERRTRVTVNGERYRAYEGVAIKN